MKNKNVFSFMAVLVFTGCFVTYQFINFCNNKLVEKRASKHLSYDEVHLPTLKKINNLIAEQRSQNPQDALFLQNLENQLLDLKMTKEIYLHNSNETNGGVPAFPIVILWGAISAFAFMLIMRKERREKSLNNSYEKILDQLEMSYSQNKSDEKNHTDIREPSSDYRPKANTEI
jgi:hypothetical protein